MGWPGAPARRLETARRPRCAPPHPPRRNPRRLQSQSLVERTLQSTAIGTARLGHVDNHRNRNNRCILPHLQRSPQRFVTTPMVGTGKTKRAAIVCDSFELDTIIKGYKPKHLWITFWLAVFTKSNILSVTWAAVYHCKQRDIQIEFSTKISL